MLGLCVRNPNCIQVYNDPVDPAWGNPEATSSSEERALLAQRGSSQTSLHPPLSDHKERVPQGSKAFKSSAATRWSKGT